MNIEEKEIINKYAEIKIEIKKLESEIDILNPQILEIVNNYKIEEVKVSNLGYLSLCKRRSWKYGPELTQKETELKAAQKLAQQTGVGADYTEKSYLLFKVDKEE